MKSARASLPTILLKTRRPYAPQRNSSALAKVPYIRLSHVRAFFPGRKQRFFKPFVFGLSVPQEKSWADKFVSPGFCLLHWAPCPSFLFSTPVLRFRTGLASVLPIRNHTVSVCNGGRRAVLVLCSGSFFLGRGSKPRFFYNPDAAFQPNRPYFTLIRSSFSRIAGPPTARKITVETL